MRRAAVSGGLATLAVASVLVVGAPDARAQPLDRPDDPVVVTGAKLTPLFGVAPDRVAAFRRSGGSWQQVPVQVDERARIDFGREPTSNGQPGTEGTVYGTTPIGRRVLQYTDPDTWVGPDPNPAVDSNDEVALMARDAGDQAGTAAPPEHVDPATGVELAVTDLLDPGAESWLYLFGHDGTLDPSAGQALVDYDFTLLSGAYRDTYLRADGPNPEDSTVTTPAYSHHFSDRWVDDELHVTQGAATGVDVLDRHRNQFGPGLCSRSEDTFSDGEGAFVANRVGPVRAIRSYLGANSGPLTQRTHVFYEARHEILTDLRVHPILGIMDVLDYAPAAAGMTYRHSAMTGTVTIDGVNDNVSGTGSSWELVRGPQGSLISSTELRTQQAFPPGNVDTYYVDDATPALDTCTGDGAAYGVSGLRIVGAIHNTDPRFNGARRFQGRRVLTYRAPGATIADAREVTARIDRPLRVMARRYSTFPPHPFTDVGGMAWYGPGLDWAAFHDLVAGFAGEFRPKDPVTRGQAVNLLWHDLDQPPAGAPHGFTDVPPDAAYDDALDWAAEAGIVTGFPGGRFRGRQAVKRAQAVNFLWVMVGQPPAGAPHGFTDVPPDAWYGPALDWAAEHGLVSGFGDQYRPGDDVNRAQFVNMLYLLAGDPDAWSGFGTPPSTVRF
jgi:hypothetical protein